MESVIFKPGITEEKRTRLILNELNILGKEIENKQIEAQCKANVYRIINTVSSLLIIVSAAIIAGLEAAGGCLNIPVLVFSGIIFFTEGTHKLCQWGPQGVLYMNGSIQLKKLYRQVREYMFSFRRYTTDQLLTLINILREQYDDVDMGLYKLSMSGHVHSGFDIDPRESTPYLSPLSTTPRDSPNRNGSRGDVHIHIDKGQTVGTDAPVLIIPSEESYTSDRLTPGTPVRNISNVKFNDLPPSPQRTPRQQSKVSTPKEISQNSNNERPVIIDVSN